MKSQRDNAVEGVLYLCLWLTLIAAFAASSWQEIAMVATIVLVLVLALRQHKKR